MLDRTFLRATLPQNTHSIDRELIFAELDKIESSLDADNTLILLKLHAVKEEIMGLDLSSYVQSDIYTWHSVLRTTADHLESAISYVRTARIHLQCKDKELSRTNTPGGF